MVIKDLDKGQVKTLTSLLERNQVRFRYIHVLLFRDAGG